jgi:hypothetical protein
MIEAKKKQNKEPYIPGLKRRGFTAKVGKGLQHRDSHLAARTLDISLIKAKGRQNRALRTH